jgi:hypothetical protein
VLKLRNRFDIGVLSIFRSNLRCILAIVLVSLAACTPLLLFGIPAGHDGIAHASWQQQFVVEMKAGAIYPRWLAGVENGTGGPVFFFYGPLVHYIGAFVSFFGCGESSIEHRLGITIWLVIVLSGISFFFSARPYIDRTGALAGSLLYMLMPYHFGIDVWTRSALAETAAYMFFPWVLSAAWRVPLGTRPVAELAVALGLLMLTHLPSALISCGLLLGLSVVRIAHGPSVICMARLCLGFALGSLLATAYVLPALSLQSMASMNLLWTGGLMFDQNFLFRSGRHAFSRPSMETIAVTTAAVALLLASGLWGFQQRRRTLVVLATTAVLLLFFLMLEASSFIWQAIGPLQRVQFPWRLMTQVDLATAFLFAFSLDRVNHHSNGWKLAAAGLLVCAPLISLNLPLVWDGHYGQMYFRNETARANWEAALATGFSTREYHTPWFAPRSSDIPLLAPEAPETVARVLQWRGRDIEFELRSSLPTSVIVRQNFLPQWRASTAGGVVLPIEPSTDGLVKMELPAGKQVVRLTLPLQRAEIVGMLGSTVGLLGTIFLMLWRPTSSRHASN